MSKPQVYEGILMNDEPCRACGKGRYVYDLSAGERVPGAWCSHCNAPEPKDEEMWHSLCGKAFGNETDFKQHVHGAECPLYASRPDLLPEGPGIPPTLEEPAKPLVSDGPGGNKTGRRGRPRKTAGELRAADARRHRRRRRS